MKLFVYNTPDILLDDIYFFGSFTKYRISLTKVPREQNTPQQFIFILFISLSATHVIYVINGVAQTR